MASYVYLPSARSNAPVEVPRGSISKPGLQRAREPPTILVLPAAWEIYRVFVLSIKNQLFEGGSVMIDILPLPH